MLYATILIASATRCGADGRRTSGTSSGAGAATDGDAGLYADGAGGGASGCDAASCDDGDLCTVKICAADACARGPVDTDDGDACTADGCEPTAGVFHTWLDCDDHDACTVDSCDAVAGCLNVPVNVDDGDVCTADACAPSGGVIHTKMDCDDGDLCTVDVCDAQAGCVHTSNPAAEDGDVCTADSCDPATGVIVHALIPDCCPHSACATGAPLNPACSYAGLNDQCVTLVCEYDPFCCTSGWDSTCVAHTEDPAICPTGFIPSRFQCDCSHSYCDVGAPLSKACDPCVKRICEVDPACCTALWDAICVAETYTVCNIPQGADCN